MEKSKLHKITLPLTTKISPDGLRDFAFVLTDLCERRLDEYDEYYKHYDIAAQCPVSLFDCPLGLNGECDKATIDKWVEVLERHMVVDEESNQP